MKGIIQKLRQYGLLKSVRFAISELRINIIHPLLRQSYSQFGEDVVLDDFLGRKASGFYVDIGAYDPYRLSNTIRFYKRGWNGIIVEPNAQLLERFKKKRPRDICILAGIGLKKGSQTFFTMDVPTLSTFSEIQAKVYEKDGFHIEKKKKVRVMRLTDIFGKYTKGKHIDFMSVDVEGYEMEVLKSNDWKMYRPQYICIESSIDGGENDKSRQIRESLRTFFLNREYALVYENGLNSIYKDIHEY